MVSVLAPTLCNLYTNDLPVTGRQKFIHIDGICLGKQACTFAERDKQTRHTWKTMPPLTQTKCFQDCVQRVPPTQCQRRS